MELEITEQNDNPLLNRQEIKVVIKHNESSTPRRNQVIKNISEQLKANRELVIIDHLKNAYGKTETHGYAKIYSDKESLSKIETIAFISGLTSTILDKQESRTSPPLISLLFNSPITSAALFFHRFFISIFI